MSQSEAERAFEERSIEALERQCPGVRVGSLPGMRLRVHLPDGRTASIGLGDAFRAFLAAGGRFEDLGPACDAHVRAALAALGGAPAAGAAPFEVVERRVLPLLEAASFFEATDEMPGAPRLLRLPLVEDELAIALVLPGEGGSMRFLSDGDLERWGRPAELLEHAARRNLEARIRGQLVLQLLHGVSAVVERSSWFKGTLVLLPSVRVRLAEILGDDPIVSVPARDHLHAFDASERDRWEPLLQDLGRRFEAAPHPLSDRLFVAEPGGLRAVGRLPE